jgi:DNA-binding NarL/FixJ family response regulator
MQKTLAGSAAPPALRLLTGRELLVLQLLARGYSREQVAALTGVPVAVAVAAVAEAERSACAALGAATVEEAVERARRRRLIL